MLFCLLWYYILIFKQIKYMLSSLQILMHTVKTKLIKVFILNIKPLFLIMTINYI